MQLNSLNSTERTTDIYERLEAYPKPPLVPLPDWQEMTNLQEMGIEDSAISRIIIQTLMSLTGFRSFYNQLPYRLEQYLRTTNMRGAGLFALINSAALALKDDPRNLTPIQRAATLILAVYSFYDDLMSGKLPPDRYKDQILEMDQYPNFFGTSLTIENGQARIFKTKKTDQITVIYRGHYYIVNVGHPGKTTSASELLETLTKIVDEVNQAGQQPNPQSPGVISGVIHPLQIRVFSNLNKNPQNRLAFETIRNSFFTLCLDLDDQPATYAEAARLTQSQNHFNRWYHSSLQIVVFGNAKACTFCNFNTYLDGNPMMRGSAELQRRGVSTDLPDGEPRAASLLTFKKLNWQVPQTALQKASQVAEKVIDHQQATFEIKDIGKTFFDQMGVLAVPAFMVVLDMAAWQLFGKHLNLIQYLSMSKYRCMNLTNANATTSEVKAFVEYVMKESQIDFQKAKQLLDEAIQSQRKAYREARKHFPPSKIISLFISTQSGFKKVWTNLLLGMSVLILKLFGKYHPMPMDVPASHPDIFEEIPVLGRPGIRLPYARYFGLHYQIWPEKIVITFMPGISLKLTNQQIFNAIQDNLAKLKTILENADSAESKEAKS